MILCNYLSLLDKSRQVQEALVRAKLPPCPVLRATNHRQPVIPSRPIEFIIVCSHGYKTTEL